MASLDLARLSIRGVTRSFGPTHALRGVDLEAAAGEVHAVIGENGAGKSTLMNVLGGAIAPDSGAVLIDGKPYAPKGPRDARAAGVAMVHQELTLCAHMTVAENVMLGREPSRFGVIQRGAMQKSAQEALEAAAGAERASTIALDALVLDLAPAERQLVEIARALVDSSRRADSTPTSWVFDSSCRLLILDEPTSSLGRDDVRRLFDRIRALRAGGLSVLYISHFLEEIEEIADRFTVLRDGKTVGSGAVAGTPMAEIVTMMAGRAVTQLFPRSPRTPGDVVLSVHALAGAEKPTDASFDLRRGEVLGIAGLVGSGRTEMLRAIFGLDPTRRGEVRAGDSRGPSSPAKRLAQGIGMLSEDRKGEGLAHAMSVADNLTLSKLTAFGPAGLLLVAPQERAAARWIERLHIRCADATQAVRDLSGGNQQKVAIGRLLHHDVEVLLLDEPTRGIDVAAKADVYALIDELAARGKAIVMVSDDLSELLGVTDRIAVMSRGVLGPARPVGEWTHATLLAEAVGAPGANARGAA